MRVRIFKLVTCKNLLVQDLITWIWAIYRSPLALWWQVREVSPRNVPPTDPITFWDCNHLTLSAIAHVFYTCNVCVYRFTIHVLYSYVYIVRYTYVMWHAIGGRGGSLPYLQLDHLPYLCVEHVVAIRLHPFWYSLFHQFVKGPKQREGT